MEMRREWRRFSLENTFGTAAGMIYFFAMKTQHISSASVRHNWKSIVRGVAAGNRYVVENYGKPEAVVISPKQAGVSEEFDLDEHFARVRRLPSVRMEDVEIKRSPEI